MLSIVWSPYVQELFVIIFLLGALLSFFTSPPKNQGNGRMIAVSDLPEEILEAIFLKLQVKELLLCKCVCQPWRTLIGSSNFVYKHLDVSIKGNTRMFMFHDQPGYKLDSFHSIEYNSVLSSLASSLTEYEFSEDAVKTYPHISPYYVDILGSCNGLLCVCTTGPRAPLEDVITLWNPSSKEYKILPSSPYQYRSNIGFGTSIYGFGYDENTNMYKVVKVRDCGVPFPALSCGSNVEVYTFPSNSWKGIETIPYHFPQRHHQKPGVSLNGALHWMAVKIEGGDDVILSFDVHNVIFKELVALEGPLLHPPGNIIMDENANSLGVLGGCLSLLFKVFLVRVDVWVMEEYGVKESWTKHYTITQESITSMRFLRILWDFENGQILLAGDYFVIYYDSTTKRDMKMKMQGVQRLAGAVTFVPSMISLNSGTYLGRRRI